MSFFWRQMGGAWVRFPVVKQIIGHEDPAPRAMVHVVDCPDDVPRLKASKRSNRLRTPDEVDSLCMHQTGVEFGTTRRQRERWGSVDAALIARFHEGTPYHHVALARGFVLNNHSPALYTYHGNGANRRSMGVAIEGNFPQTLRRKPKHTELTKTRIEAGKEAMRMAHRRATGWGATIKFVTPHRAWSKNRSGDTGPELWKLIVAPMMEELGLTLLDHVDTKKGGRTVPDEWWP